VQKIITKKSHAVVNTLSLKEHGLSTAATIGLTDIPLTQWSLSRRTTKYLLMVQ